MERSLCPAEREGVYCPIGAGGRREARPQNAAFCESADGGVSLGSQLNQARLERFTRSQCIFALPFLIALIDYFGVRKIIAVPNPETMKSAVRSPAFRPQAFGVTECIRTRRLRPKGGTTS